MALLTLYVLMANTFLSSPIHSGTVSYLGLAQQVPYNRSERDPRLR